MMRITNFDPAEDRLKLDTISKFALDDVRVQETADGSDTDVFMDVNETASPGITQRDPP